MSPEAQRIAGLVAFLSEKLKSAEKSLAAREQMEAVWKSGTSSSWRKVGCTKSRL
jgi:hypothetical protein